MNIDLEKFWDFVKQWSVGRLMILLLLLAFIFNASDVIENLGNELFFNLILIAVLLEIFELSANHLRIKKDEDKFEYSWILIFTVLFPVFGILFFLIKSILI